MAGYLMDSFLLRDIMYLMDIAVVLLEWFSQFGFMLVGKNGCGGYDLDCYTRWLYDVI